MLEIKINKNEAGQRFDKFLFKFFKEASGGFIYKMLRKKNIVLNDKKSDGKDILAFNDSVKIYMKDETIDKFRGIISFEKVDYYDLDIIYEDNEVLFANKKPGTLSQKSEENDVSINEQIISYLIDKGEISIEDLKTFKPSICNRLDRNTSGLIVFGKTLSSLQELSKLFKNRTVDKYYTAIVDGVLESNIKLDGYLVKDEKTNKVFISDHIKEGAKQIKTNIKVLRKTKDYSVLKVELVTGKTHQIRAHLASIGHPIMGDNKYGCSRELADKYNIKRTLLHSCILKFNDTTLSALKNKRFIADYPDDIRRMLEE